MSWHALSASFPTVSSTRFYSPNTLIPSELTPNDKRPVVITGPSGSGKSTLIDKLFRDYPSTFGFSVSHTTRKPRPGEVNGVAYHFVSMETMQQLIAQDRFLEHAVFSANHYGTSKSAVRDVIESGKTCILDVDLQGVRRIRESGLPARYIFVRPKNLETLEKRLRDRDTESEEAIQRRMLRAKEEWTYGIEPANFDHVVVNDQLDRAYMDLCDFIMPQ